MVVYLPSWDQSWNVLWLLSYSGPCSFLFSYLNLIILFHRVPVLLASLPTLPPALALLLPLVYISVPSWFRFRYPRNLNNVPRFVPTQVKSWVLHPQFNFTDGLAV